MAKTHGNVIKRVVDVCLTVLLLFLMAYQVTGEVLHEWIGIGMVAVLIVHHILNRRWYGALFKGRYNAYRIVTTIVNTLYGEQGKQRKNRSASRELSLALASKLFLLSI